MKRFATACTAAVFALGFASAAFAADKPERTWAAKCASCHGEAGKGDTPKGKELGAKDYSAADWQKSKTDDQIKAGIENGVKDKMDGYKDKLKPEQVEGLVKFIRTFK
jgi:mono/diheme cytochrome c family protein